MNTQLKFKVNALRTLASPYKKNEKEEATTFEIVTVSPASVVVEADVLMSVTNEARATAGTVLSFE